MNRSPAPREVFRTPHHQPGQAQAGHARDASRKPGSISCPTPSLPPPSWRATWVGVITENKNGRPAGRAASVIDATGDGDLAARAGAPYRKGREPDGGMQPVTIMFKVAGVDYSRAVFPGSFETNFEIPGGRIQDLGHAHLPHPAGHVLLYPSSLPGVVTVNMTNQTGIDGTLAEDLTRAELACRRQIEQIVPFLRDKIPGYEKCFLISTASLMGVRETRHFIGDYTLTAEDIVERGSSMTGSPPLQFQLRHPQCHGAGARQGWRAAPSSDQGLHHSLPLPPAAGSRACCWPGAACRHAQGPRHSASCRSASTSGRVPPRQPSPRSATVLACWWTSPSAARTRRAGRDGRLGYCHAATTPRKPSKGPVLIQNGLYRHPRGTTCASGLVRGRTRFLRGLARQMRNAKAQATPVSKRIRVGLSGCSAYTLSGSETSTRKKRGRVGWGAPLAHKQARPSQMV